MDFEEGSSLFLLNCKEVGEVLQRPGLKVRSFLSRKRFTDRARTLHPRACVLRADGKEPLEDTCTLITSLRKELPITDFVVWLPKANGRQVRTLLQAGARDVALTGDAEEAAQVVQAVLEQQQLFPRLLRTDGSEEESWRFEGMVSRSRKLWDVFETCVRTAKTDATVLILGETGTGKELLARAIHRRSGRTGPFVALNCGAVPESLIDSELFGHERGAFTGATGRKEGLYRHADGGSLLLDEIGNIPLAAQFRLLRTLQEGTVRPVGGHEEVEVDVRVIAATSSALNDAVAAGTFREDLLYRLDVIRFVLPPLRERPEDIVFLFGHFLRELSEQYNIPRPELSDSFLDQLQAYDWPGNVRQMENFVERLLLTHRQQRLTGKHFRKLLRPFSAQADSGRRRVVAPEPEAEPEVDTQRPLAKVLARSQERVERAYLERCLRENQGRMGATAKQAGISRRTLLRKLKAYRIDKREFR